MLQVVAPKFRLLILAVLAVGAGVILPTPGNASTCNTAVNTTSTACVVESGNNENQNLNTIVAGGLFGINTWSEVAASVSAGSTVGPLTAGAGTTSGTWSVSNFTNVLAAMLTVKAGDQFAAYLLDTSSPSGTWSTLGLLVGSGQQPGISGLALYETFCGGTTGITCPSHQGTTPLPGAVWLFGTALAGAAGVGSWRRKKKKSDRPNVAA
jgi:hypothetical protein